MTWLVTGKRFAELEARYKRDTGGMASALAQAQTETASVRETNEKLRKLCNALEAKQRDLDTPPISSEDLVAHLRTMSELQSENGSLFRVNAELSEQLTTWRERAQRAEDIAKRQEVLRLSSNGTHALPDATR